MWPPSAAAAAGSWVKKNNFRKKIDTCIPTYRQTDIQTYIPTFPAQWSFAVSPQRICKHPARRLRKPEKRRDPRQPATTRKNAKKKNENGENTPPVEPFGTFLLQSKWPWLVSNMSGVWCLAFCYYVPMVMALENVTGVVPLSDQLKLSIQTNCPRHLDTRGTLNLPLSLHFHKTYFTTYDAPGSEGQCLLY